MRTHSLANTHCQLSCSWHISTTSMVDRDIRSNHMVKHLTIWFVHAAKLPATNHQIPQKAVLRILEINVSHFEPNSELSSYNFPQHCFTSGPLLADHVDDFATIWLTWGCGGNGRGWQRFRVGGSWVWSYRKAHDFIQVYSCALTSNTHQVKLLTTQSDGGS